MTRTNILATLVVFVGIGASLATSVHSSGGFSANFVELQSSTPGTADTGHINVTGTVLAGKVSATASGTAIYGESTTSGGFGIFGKNMMPYASAITGIASMATGIGVYGEGVNGVNGYADQTVGVGVSGHGKNGVSGMCSPGGIAVVGQTWDPSSTAIYGMANHSNSYAGLFEGRVRVSGNMGVGALPSTARLNVVGNQADAAIIENTGAGRGVRVIAGSDTGVWSETNSGWAGVDGRTGSTGGAGVVGGAWANSGTNYGVHGWTNSPDGWGVWANGRLGASGTKPFRIDHPLDPENKYLFHYSSESPEPQNFYNGVVRTNAKGEAWVQLPDYFESINRDFRYTLTVIEDVDSDQFVLAKVARKIEGNRFKIRTNAPNVEVSWEVKAIRNDPWVQRYGAPKEPAKPESERGKYLHPELYDQPAERGTFYRPAPVRPETPPESTIKAKPLMPPRPRGN